MPDIFISYSRKDSEQAELLTEMLASAGLSCWIDKQGIDVATSWSASIVDAINECTAFIVMLSSASIESHNVIKEVSLASEKRKKILPLDLEPVSLPRELEYQLAGIQRAPMTNIDAIIRALGNLGLQAIGAPQPPKIVGAYGKAHRPDDGRKSLMILPFEDLSPTADNQWFADGIVSELISALSNIKALKISDAQETKEFRSFKGHLTTYAREMQIRYFVQGDVRKFGDQIKISARLLDIETGDHLWQDSIKGTMNDVFEIQETVANKVVGGLKLHLAADEKKKLAERGTENAEAYELYLRADEYYSRKTREGFRLAIQQLTLALGLEPSYANALQFKALALAVLYRSYDRDPHLLTEAGALASRALAIKPDLWGAYDALSQVYRLQGRLTEAEEAARECIRRAPNEPASHFSLGFFYAEADQPALAIEPYERSLELDPDDLASYFNLVSASDRSHDKVRVEKWSRLALPSYERRLRLAPDDETTRVHYANLLQYAGEPERAAEAIAPLLRKPELDGISLYAIACLYARLNDTVHALESVRRAVAAGFAYVENFRTDPDLSPLRGMPEFEELIINLEGQQNG